jgi:type I restriction enzyme S subunit
MEDKKEDEKERKIPEVRFKGFTNEWKQRKVKEMCSIATGKINTQDKVDDGEYPFYVRSPIIERSTKYLYDEEAVLTVGDGVGTGKVFHYVNGKYDLHQRCYRMYGFSDELDAKYFYHTFSHLFYKRVMAMTAKTSVDSVRLEMIADMEIPTPCIEEQRAIGRYFSHLDSLITLHQRKLETLQKMKKAMLQKMFPFRLPDGQANGERVPEIRFKGFTGDWEERKLGDIVTVYDGVHQTPNYQTSGVMFLSVENIATLKSNKFISVEDFKRDYKVYPQKNDILMTRIGDVGTTNVVTDNDVKAYYVSLALLKYKATSPFFLSSAIQSDFVQKGLSNRTLKMAIPMKINKDEIGQIDVMLPISADEQEKIGAFFRTLDKLITLQKKKCETFRNTKKAMLEKMFV